VTGSHLKKALGVAIQDLPTDQIVKAKTTNNNQASLITK
jgi:hypothetical protein